MRQFSPLPQPYQEDPGAQELADNLGDVQQEIENSLSTVHDLDVVGRPPDKTEDGMIRYADGVAWDPGWGEGLYVYEEGVWRKIADVDLLANELVFAAYGGIEQFAPNVPGPDIGAGWQTITTFNAAAVSNPRYITQDFANNGLIINRPGIWAATIYLGFEHDSSNQGRVTYVRIFNFNTGVGDTPTVIATGRNAEATVFSITTLFEVLPADVGDLWQLQIGSGSTYTSVDWDAAIFEIFSVGPWAAGLAALKLSR